MKQKERAHNGRQQRVPLPPLQHLAFPVPHRRLALQNLPQGQAVEGTVADTHPRMRPHQRERFPDDQDLAIQERSPRGRAVPDRRHEWQRRLVDQFEECGRHDLRGVVFLLLPDLGPHFAHGERVAMGVAVGVGEVFLQGRGAGRAVVVPDVVDEAFPRLEGAVFSGDRVTASV